MFDDFRYVVIFENGMYYRGDSISMRIEDKETDELKYAAKYVFEWQIPKDLYLNLYCDMRELTYKVLKLRTIYEIIE